ncbi:MAG: hypothetical protein ACI8YQ_002301 [Polaribacter sp.]|jgi:hypothetical protein
MKTILLSLFASLSFFTLSSQTIPVDFEDNGNGADWVWTVFENDTNPALEIIENPDPSGFNNSSTVAKFTALQAGEPYVGCETSHGAGIGSFTIDASNAIIRISVWKSVISDVGIKLVRNDDWSLEEIKMANTVVDEWEQLTFDFSAHIGNTYDQLVIFPDFAARTSDNVIYFDDVYGEVAIQTAVDNLNNNQLTVYPNPAQEKLMIRSDEQIDEIEIYTLAGKLVDHKKNVGTESDINVNQLSEGMYLLKATINGQTIVDKFIKE